MVRPKKFSRRPPGGLNVTEAARYMGVHRVTFLRYRDTEPDFPTYTVDIDGQIWYNKSELREWAAKRGVPLPDDSQS